MVDKVATYSGQVATYGGTHSPHYQLPALTVPAI